MINATSRISMAPLRPLIVGLGIALLSSNMLSAEAQEMSPGQFQVSLTDDRVSLEAEEVPLGQLLETLAQRSGFQIEIRGSIDGLVSQSIVDLPLHLAIAQILTAERFSYVLKFAAADPGTGLRKISKLTVISRQGTPLPKPSAPVAREIIPESPEYFDEQDREENLEAIEVLEEILREEQDPEIRQAMAEALLDLEAIANDL